MAKEGGFFSPNRKLSRKDKQVGQISSATSDLSGLTAAALPSDYKETESQVNFENMLRKNFDDPDSMDYGIKQFIKDEFQKPDGTYDSPYKFQDNLLNKALTDKKIARSEVSEADDFANYMKEAGIRYPKSLPDQMIRMLKENYRDDKRDGFYKDGQFLNQSPTDANTQIAGAFGMSDDEIERRKNLNEIINTPGYDPKSVTEAQRQLIRLNQGLSPFDKKVEAPKENILQKVGGFLANVFTGTQPVAAGTLDANQQVSQVSERPKLSYVNPDAKTMSLSEIGQAFKPSNLFGYKDKFGRFDDPGSPLARDRAETIQRVAQNFSSPIVGDARTIGQIRADQDARMRENAKLRYDSFKRGERVQQKSADVTYGTNMLSNPAFGFRDKMTDAAKAKYDQSAKDATEMARTDPSLGNVAMQTFNRISGLVGGPQGSLESIGERQLRLANKEINRPTYQKEAYARKMLGITNDQLKARNLQQIRANAAARNQAFQSDRRAKAVERVARRYGQNKGSGRTGGFGSGTVGKGMSSNPASQRQQGVGVSANNLSRHSVGHSSTQPGSKKGGPKGGGPKGGGPKGGGPKGGGGPSGGGGSPKSSGQNKSLGKKGRVGRKVRCDIQTKIDITLLTNQNLIKDDLATVAYFVQELRGE